MATGVAHYGSLGAQKHTASNCKLIVHGCCLSWHSRGCRPRPGHRYMQRDALRACIMDVHYGMVTVSDSGRSLSVLSVELRLIVVVVYTWSATVMSAALQNVTVIKPRRVQQKLTNSSKIDGQRWPIRIQRDFLTFITKSNASSSRSQLCSIL